MQADNMEASKSDATLFSYTYAHAEIPITALRVGVCDHLAGYQLDCTSGS